MNELLKILREGKFEQDSYCLILDNRQRLWTSGGIFEYDFHPNNGAGFTFSEKLAIKKALKEGNLVKASKLPPTEGGDK